MMRTQNIFIRYPVFILSMAVAFILSACESSTSSKSSYAVNFSVKSASSRSPQLGRLTPDITSCGTNTVDIPGMIAGLGCTGDSRIKVRYQTPTTYKLAFKSVYLKKDDSKVYVINNAQLSDITSSSIISFNSTITKTKLSSADGFSLSFVPTSIGWEIYYFQLTITMYGKAQEIRIYMSDDDFPAEGSKGHHQGDITFFDSSGQERWAKGGYNTWLSDLSPTTLSRGDFANGAGGTDSQTGHARGMFGDKDLWNQSKLAQGANQDYYYDDETFDAVGSGTDANVTFDISNTWFYDKFSDGLSTSDPLSFDPCLNGSHEACGGTPVGSWAPLYPTITVTQD